MELWQTVLVAVISAASALGGIWLGQRGQRAEAATQREAERRRLTYEEHRDAIVAMVTLAEQAAMFPRGGVYGGDWNRGHEAWERWRSCLPIVELLVGESMWTQLLPYVAYVTALHEDSAYGTTAEADYEKLRAQFLAVARDHLKSLR